MSRALTKAAAVSASCSNVALGPARRCTQSAMPSASMRPEHGAGLPPPLRPSRPPHTATPPRALLFPPRHITTSTLPPHRHIGAVISPSPSPPTRPVPPHSPTAVRHRVGAIAVAEEFERGEGLDVELGAQGRLRHGVHLAQPC